ncbi:DNA-binding protein [Blastococcus litoris]|uniref:DNA-binding protein n=1 Tax=Blastococcus litoris TaxID=2171622 RepID=UPI000E2FF92B|nr:DNA-binding protein [Blastococcus litoris]
MSAPGELPREIGRPATAALTEAGYTTLRSLDGVPARDLLAMHGVGPKAVAVLRTALADHGLSLG